ncbi:NEL-type E3 ubiquitin ligase domain-containing protein [Pseudomonas antarctica]|uniref:NEL-type E3 ubiquitin ligase domain-containing protein n=1 Tax=Pseudomonas antarctica TaxID=219572 RepID=UPI00387B315B
MADSIQSSSPVPPTSDTPKVVKLTATQSLHGDFLEQASPQWLIDATPVRKQALKEAGTVAPAWLQNASPEQRSAVTTSLLASFTAQTQLDKTMATFQDINDFARPLLLNALKDQYQVQVDVDKTLLCLRRPLAVGVIEIEVSSFQFLKLSMLEAALHNVEAYECKEGAYHKTSGFIEATDKPDTYHSVAVNVSVSQFLTLCRNLDIGAQYQAYLQGFFYPEEAAAQITLREHFIASQKAAVKAAAEQALVTGDIEPADHRMILSVINGEIHPRLGDKQVWFRTLSLMKLRMTGCMAFVICKKYTYPDELILYIPQDPVRPLKRYRWSQMADEFKRLFTARDSATPADAKPTPYQVFFSRFVPYEKRAYYFSQFTQKAADSPTDIWRSPWKKILDFTTPHFITGIKELPPEAPAKLEPKSDPYLAPSTLQRRGHGIWAANIDPWKYFYEQHREQVIADARAHAVPTADVDARARDEKLAHLLEVGMLGLNMVSMFVPVLGEVMMVVMAGQLLYETLEGSIEWAEGDLQAAKAHLIDVAENLAQIAVMAGVGATVSQFRAAKPEPVIESLSPVTLPNGETRLWRPDLSGYESTVSLDASSGPNALGQHKLDGKTYIRQAKKVYEQVFDESIKKWRIKHPARAEVYQPILESNGRGAWRHSLERPLEWDRLTLLRRMGHETEAFSDTELIKVADVSGVSDSALRKMHMDLAPPPPELLDAMRLFKADAGAEQVIEQLRGTRPIDERYLYTLPLVAEMPRWPKARVLEVFEGPGLWGESVKYGAGRLPKGATAKAPIRISRRDVMGGELSEHILVALDEQEIVKLLGAEGARVRESRLAEFTRQIADYAQTRKPAIFDSLYAGTEPVDAQVRLLQRTCPGLSEAAGLETLAHASPDDLKRLEATRREPLSMLEEARWYARQGRQTRAYAGLRSETMASANSRRLALHTLEKLPGWPDTLRLEVREGSDSGALLDSIGSDTARDKRYLVKKGPRFQAFNERGEQLNSLPAEGDNFYASLMHAMPDDARRGLGVPQVSQSALLQEKIIEFADLYRSEAPQLLEPKRKPFKPPVRVNETLVGYYASGRAPGQSANLESRAQHLYGLSDTQASDYILRLQATGKTNKEIFNHLENRRREYTELVSTLDEWVGPQGSTPSDTAAYRYRTQVANQLKEAWRREPLAGTVSNADCLHIVVDEHLPPLTIDYSHIRELGLVGQRMNDAGTEAFLARFPNVQTLSIGDTAQLWGAPLTGARSSLTTVPPAVTKMTRLKTLKFSTAAEPLAPGFSSALNSLTSLEALHIDYRGFSSAALNGLDLSALVQLKQLHIDASYGLSQWPINVENLPRLERLDLSRTAIGGLPATLYSGHEQLWAGLSMDWSRFSRKTFKPAYEYVRNYQGEQGHLVDLHQMVNGYTKGQLQSLILNSSLANALREKIMVSAQTPEARFDAIEDLSERYDDIFASFYYPSAETAQHYRVRSASWQSGPNAHVISALETNWWGAVGERYGIPSQTSVFELPAPGGQMMPPSLPVSSVELPELPAASFAHVRTLRMRWLGETTEQTRGFTRAFSETQTLDLSANGLTEIPINAGDLPALTRLNLFNNRLAMPAFQAQLNDFNSLELLDLSYNSNPLTGLDVSALTKLSALNLRGTKLQAWPTGAERLPQLAWLDLRDNQLTSLPTQVLANDALLMKTHLAGNQLSPIGEVELESARQRVEAAQGLPQGALARFEQHAEPAVFPPQETGLTLARYLLPMPGQIAVPEGAAGFVSRLQRLTPAVTEENALQWFEQLRQVGVSDPDIDTLLTTWHQQYETLTRQTNGWLYNPDLLGTDMSLVADQRRLAALKIVECWQTGVSAEAGYELSLHGLQVNNLPELTVQFSHVHTLDLTGVQFSATGADGFLNCFPALRKLGLSGNQLTAVPEAVERMTELETLDLAANAISDPQPLYRQLSGTRLRRLDLRANELSEFSTLDFGQLESLDLSYNRLSRFPRGALTATHLRTLNLCGNRIEILPAPLLDGLHEDLVRGTDLSENETLTLETFEEMRDYSNRHQGAAVMGWSRRDIDGWIRGFESDESGPDSNGGDDDDDDAPVRGPDVEAVLQPLEPILDPQGDTAEAVLTSWLAHSPADLVASRRQLWLQLAQEPGHERFFHLIERLRDTDEYRFSVADLTRRVWDVIEVAADNAQMREVLFVSSETHGTCADGRILTFSSMEVLVFEAQILRDVPTQNLTLRGQRLLDLSRQLFRLDQVDALAERKAVGRDRAEVRLAYRVGMTGGWPDGLELPGQPKHIAFIRPISGTVLANARSQVLRAQASDAFYESLVARDYWNNYLRERYPDEFQALQRDAARRHEAVEDEHADRVQGTESQERYNEALNRLVIEDASARIRLLLELSRREAPQPSTRAVGTAPSKPESPQPGPSSRQ